jgi:hypothetical protein
VQITNGGTCIVADDFGRSSEQSIDEFANDIEAAILDAELSA